MEPWYKVVQPRKEVRDGRSFDPDEFAIHLEQVVAGTAPEDYRDPKQFFSRNVFTRALRDHAGMVLRRLAGKTENTPPVLTLITQFGGGKTHTLAALYHLASNGSEAASYPGVPDLLTGAGLAEVPEARVAAFVGNAWDPEEGRETPWIDVARQLAGQPGVTVLGPAAKTTPPGTQAIAKVFEAAGKPVLVLFDEVLNFLNRHRDMADAFYAFLQNLTVAMTATTHGAAVVSLPRSQVEMSERDLQWQERITKVVRRVAKDLIANDESEIGEVVRRRLFEDLGGERTRKAVAKAYADWCFERRAQLPPEWTAVDTVTAESKARDFLQTRFEACYPFHPATLSVFQRKWQALPQYQQTRGTLAMLAQWISCAFREGYQQARREPLITLGSAPLDSPDFRAVVLGQLGESRLEAALLADISGPHSHAGALDADTKGPLRDIHRRVGATVLFECSGGQVDRVAHLPELRFALGEPEIDTTSVDNAAFALESKAFFIRRVGSDGFQIRHRPTLKKVVSDRRASLDWETEIKPAMEELVKAQFRAGAAVPVVAFPEDSTAISDSPKLTVVVMSPEVDWTGQGEVRERIAEWTRQRGKSPRLYPGSLVWCVKQPGRDLREAVEVWLAWRRVQREIADGTLGSDIERSERSDIQARLADAEGDARDEVWAGYRFLVLGDSQGPDGLATIDLGAGHASSGETLTGRIITALRSAALLNESVGAGYLGRNWPPAHKDSGAWPLAGLRQAFLDGSLTRLIDPDKVLGAKIPEFVERGDFGLASGQRPDGTYDHVWFKEMVPADEVAFEAGVFLLTKSRAQSLKAEQGAPAGAAAGTPPTVRIPPAGVTPTGTVGGEGETAAHMTRIRLVGDVQPEIWNRLGTKLFPRLRLPGTELRVAIDLEVTLDAKAAASLERDVRQILSDLRLADRVRIEKQEA